ncbi:spermidine synthase [Myxococcota bacterium]|nr:spermidine synthase [Myxococcota bacterium]MBU1383201.1 spermidine synthase [Myxococcota bacterium]MBU1496435.1 spermidine synthase [Myxococcota bacterium]
MIWTRILHYSFGSTEMAAATVLATFMGGFAIGGALGGKIAPKLKQPILVYGFLEGIVAVFGIIFTPMLYRLDVIYSITGPDPSPLLLTSLKFATGMAIMLIPTVAMGATLPIIVHGVVPKSSAGKGFSVIYFINTLGAVGGTLLAGFSIIPKFGLDKGVYVAASIGIFVFIFSALIQWKWKPVPQAATAKEENGVPVDEAPFMTPMALKYGAYIALAIAFFSGFISLSNEVLWFRLLGIILDGTIYGFSALLGAFLLGIALGSFWISYYLDRCKDPWGLFVKLQIGAAVGSVLTILIIPLIPFIVSGYISGAPKAPGDVFFLKVVLVFFVILVPTFFYGASFPVLVRLASIRGRLSSAVGNVYSLNTAGCILGSAMIGMVLIPWLKNINLLLMIMVFLSILLAFAAIFFAGGANPEKASNTKIKLFASIAVMVLGVIILNPDVKVIRLVNSRYSIEDYQHSIGSSVKTLYGDSEDRKNLVFEAEGAVTVVTVHKHKDGGFRLKNNGLNESYHAVTQPYYAEEILYLAALPYLLHPKPEKAMLIGLGGGGTADVLSQLELKTVEVAELEPEVVKASRLMFGKRTHPADRKHVKMRLDDGRNALTRHAIANPHTYDLIISQPSHPWLTGASNLYTVEHFRIVKKNLKPGGIFCQWVNLFRMNETGFRSLLAAFTIAFEDGHIFQVDPNSVFLIGANGKLPVDPAVISKHYKEPFMKTVTKNYGSSVNRILKMYRFNFAMAKKLAAGSKVNSDHHPIIETVLPWVGHNQMFDVLEWLDKKNVPYYLSPEVIVQSSMTKDSYREYIDYLINDIDIYSQDADTIKPKMELAFKNIVRWEKFLGEDAHRLRASVYKKILDHHRTAMELSKIKAPSDADLRHLASYNVLSGNRFDAFLIYLRLVGNANPGFYTSWLLNNLSSWIFREPVLNAQTMKDGDFVELTRLLDGLPLLNGLIDSAVDLIRKDPAFLSKRNIFMLETILRSSFRRNKINPREVEAYIDEGGENRRIVRDITYYYVLAGDKEKADSAMSVFRNSSSMSATNYETAKKLIKLDGRHQAMQLFTEILKDTEHGIEKGDILRNILDNMIELKHFSGFGKLWLQFRKNALSEDNKKATENILKKFDKFNQGLIEKGFDPKELAPKPTAVKK